MLEDIDWGFDVEYRNPEYTFMNQRKCIIAHTYDSGIVLFKEVIDLHFSGGWLTPDRRGSIYDERTFTLTAEYATQLKLQGNYHELFNGQKRRIQR